MPYIAYSYASIPTNEKNRIYYHLSLFMASLGRPGFTHIENQNASCVTLTLHRFLPIVNHILLR